MFDDLRKFTFLTGKGGVEKTSLACATAVSLADAGKRVLLVSTDPASNVGQVFGQEIGSKFRPMMRLQDPDKTRVLIVTLPETTPVLEAERLQRDLGRADITPFGWGVNASIAATGTHHPQLQARAATEAPEIARVRNGLARRAAVVAMQVEDPVGAARLRTLAGKDTQASVQPAAAAG